MLHPLSSVACRSEFCRGTRDASRKQQAVLTEQGKGGAILFLHPPTVQGPAALAASEYRRGRFESPACPGPDPFPAGPACCTGAVSVPETPPTAPPWSSVCPACLFVPAIAPAPTSPLLPPRRAQNTAKCLPTTHSHASHANTRRSRQGIHASHHKLRTTCSARRTTHNRTRSADMHLHCSCCWRGRGTWSMDILRSHTLTTGPHVG